MKRVILPLIILISFSGCYLKSVHPLVSEEDSILVPGLEGTWLNGSELWVFANDARNVPNLDYARWDMEYDSTEDAKLGADMYLVFIADIENPDEEPLILIGRVTKLNDLYFLDLSYDELFYTNEQPSMIEAHRFPVHTFSKLSIEKEEGQLSIEFLASDWIKSLIEDNRVRIKHEKADDEILVTASTNDLRKFVEKYSDDEQAYEDPINLIRSYDNF